MYKISIYHFGTSSHCGFLASDFFLAVNVVLAINWLIIHFSKRLQLSL